MKISKKKAEHYLWGDQCDGWFLVKNTNLTVIHERMPPNTYEVRHHHHLSRQFFFVISGSATLEMNGETIELAPQEGVEVPPMVPHQMMNRTNSDLEFLVISQPNSRGDRYLSEDESMNLK